VELPHPEAVVTMVEKPAAEAAGGSTAHDTALVMVSTSFLSPPPASQFSDNLCLEDDVVLEFDATHLLSKLTTTWEGLSARAASIGEQLQVSIFFFFFLVVQLLLLLFLISFFFMWEKSFSWDHSNFFGLDETKKKLAFELSQLKAELASKEAELDTECQGRQTSERALRTQVIEVEQRRDEVMAVLRESSGKSDRLMKECEGIPSSYIICFLLSFISLFFICLTFSNCLDQPFIEISRSSQKILKR
jgi:hypothetical protein